MAARVAPSIKKYGSENSDSVGDPYYSVILLTIKITS